MCVQSFEALKGPDFGRLLGSPRPSHLPQLESWIAVLLALHFAGLGFETDLDLEIDLGFGPLLIVIGFAELDPLAIGLAELDHFVGLGPDWPVPVEIDPDCLDLGQIETEIALALDCLAGFGLCRHCRGSYL